MKTTAKSQHLRAFLISAPEDGKIDRFRSNAIRALDWAEESNSDPAELDVQVRKISEGFTTNTGIAVPEYVKPSKVQPRAQGIKTPVKKAPSKKSIKKGV